MIERNEFVKKYSQEIIGGTAAIFAGAGLSVDAGFVDWKTLLEPFAQQINLNVDKETDLVSIAQYYVNEHNNNRNDLYQELKNRFSTSLKSSQSMSILARLPISTYWTTNYDNQIEDTLEKNKKLVEIKRSSNDLTTNTVKRDAVVYKMHGDMTDISRTVLVKDDYEMYETNYPLFRTALRADLLSKTFLFIGFSFADPNINYVLSKIHENLGEGMKTNYCIFKKISRLDYESETDFNYRSLKFTLQLNDLQRYGITPVLVNEYSEIPDILTEIEQAVLRKNIFISGSIDDEFPEDKGWDKKEAESFAKELSEKLVKENYKIISGFGLGIGSFVITGALREINENKYGHLSDYLELYPFPQIPDNGDREQLWTRYREEMLKDAGVAIFMFGEKIDSVSGCPVAANGMIEEYEISKKNNKLIIPIGSTGWAARQIFNLEADNLTNNLHLTSDEFNILRDSSNRNELVGLVTDLVKRNQLMNKD